MVLAVALALLPFLPLYIERTMVRSMVVGQAGDVVEMDWKFSSLNGFRSHYSYFRPEQYPAFWLAVNLLLFCVYALVIAFGMNSFLVRRKKRE